MAWTKQSKNTSSWNEQSKNTSSWNDQSKNTSSWGKQTKNTNSWANTDKSKELDAFLLLEDGGYLLQEDDYKIALESEL